MKNIIYSFKMLSLLIVLVFSNYSMAQEVSLKKQDVKTKEKINQIPDNQSLSGFFIFSKYCISPQKTVMITGEIGGLDIYLKKSTELDHISLIFRFLRGSKPTRKN